MRSSESLSLKSKWKSSLLVPCRSTVIVSVRVIRKRECVELRRGEATDFNCSLKSHARLQQLLLSACSSALGEVNLMIY